MRPWNFSDQQRILVSEETRTRFIQLDAACRSALDAGFGTRPATALFPNVALLQHSTLFSGNVKVSRAIAAVAGFQHGLSNGKGPAKSSST